MSKFFRMKEEKDVREVFGTFTGIVYSIQEEEEDLEELELLDITAV